MRATSPQESEGKTLEASFIPERANLTKKQTEFLALYTTCAFLPIREVCRQAGITHSQLNKWKLKSLVFRRQMEIEHNRTQQAAGMQRKHVLSGILEAIEIAKSQRQPTAMISGWKEVGRMCGFYEPDRKEITLSVDKKEFMRDIKSMSTRQLLEYAKQDILEEVMEGEFEVVDEI